MVISRVQGPVDLLDAGLVVTYLYRQSRDYLAFVAWLRRHRDSNRHLSWGLVAGIYISSVCKFRHSRRGASACSRHRRTAYLLALRIPLALPLLSVALLTRALFVSITFLWSVMFSIARPHRQSYCASQAFPQASSRPPLPPASLPLGPCRVLAVQVRQGLQRLAPLVSKSLYLLGDCVFPRAPKRSADIFILFVYALHVSHASLRY